MEVGQPPSYNNDSFTAFIPFVNEKDNDFTKAVRCNIQVPKYHGYQRLKPVYEHNPQMDTGSTGLAISARDLGYTIEEQLEEYEKGKEYLSSSRVYYEGYWVPTTVTFPDGNVSAEVKILAVTFKGRCVDFNETTGNCDRISEGLHFPPEICYLGVGFGRWSKQQPGGTADRNPLLNIVKTNDGMTISRSTIHQGYVITETGVWVGLAESNTRDFRFTKLSPNPETKHLAQPKEWNGTNVFINYHDANMEGTALFDTGISQSYFSAPVFQDCHHLPPEDQYTVKIGNQADNPIETLHMTVGDFTNPITPPYVKARPRKPAFINTGRFFYRSFDLLLDAGDGWLGLRKRELRNPSRTSWPSVSSQRERSLRPGTETRDSDEES